jgi:protein SCO1/2
MLRLIRLFSLLLVVLLGGTWAFAWVTRAPGEGLGEAFAGRLSQIFGGNQPVPALGGVQLPQGLVLGGAFTLLDQTGKVVTERDFAGKWLLVYFGYTFCPDICPTELGTVAAALDTLGAVGEQVTPVFVTIDPERDTPEAMAAYVERFHPRMLGLTGTPEQVAEAARRYRVYYAKAQTRDAGQYLMDHSSFIYLVGPDAKVRALFRPEASPDAIAATVRAQLQRATAAS